MSTEKPKVNGAFLIKSAHYISDDGFLQKGQKGKKINHQINLKGVATIFKFSPAFSFAV